MEAMIAKYKEEYIQKAELYSGSNLDTCDIIKMTWPL